MYEDTQCARWSIMKNVPRAAAELLLPYLCTTSVFVRLFVRWNILHTRFLLIQKLFLGMAVQTDLLHQTASVRHAVLNDCNETAAGIT